MSFTFDVITDRWGTDNGIPCRDVVEAKLYEVAYVVFPAYPTTEAGLRAKESGLSPDENRVLQKMNLALGEAYALKLRRKRLDLELRVD